MGFVSPGAAAHWGAWTAREGAAGGGGGPFEGLAVAVAPFTAANREERDMLITAGAGRYRPPCHRMLSNPRNKDPNACRPHGGQQV